MELPEALRNAIEKQATAQSQAQLRASAEALSLRYRTQTGTGARLLTRKEEAVAYAAVRMPATYGAVSTALRFALEHLRERPRTLLDVGAGTGAATWAALAQLELQSAVCLEREPAMLQLGEALMEGAEPFKDRVNWKAFTLGRDPLSHADLVIAAYVLGELNAEERHRAAQALWEATDSMLLLVEPGTPTAHQQMMQLKQLLLECGASLAAPCPQEGACPLPAGDWCHSICRIARTRLHRQLKEGQAPYEDEKFTYLAFSRQPCERAQARVLRHPVIASGHVTVSLCTAEGTKRRTFVKKESIYRRARSAEAGEALELNDKNSSSPVGDPAQREEK